MYDAAIHMLWTAVYMLYFLYMLGLIMNRGE